MEKKKISREKNQENPGNFKLLDQTTLCLYTNTLYTLYRDLGLYIILNRRTIPVIRHFNKRTIFFVVPIRAIFVSNRYTFVPFKWSLIASWFLSQNDFTLFLLAADEGTIEMQRWLLCIWSPEDLIALLQESHLFSLVYLLNY